MEVDLHLGQKFRQGTLRQPPNDVFLLVEIQRLFSHAQFADECAIIILLLLDYSGPWLLNITSFAASLATLSCPASLLIFIFLLFFFRDVNVGI